MSLLGVDVGTSGCKAAAFSSDGGCLAIAYQEYSFSRPLPEYAELNSLEVWEKTKQVIKEVAAATGKDKVQALCVSSLGEAMVPVSKRREILGSSILSFDRRGTQYSQALIKEFGLEKFYRLNRNLPGPHFSLPKLLWVKEKQPKLYQKADYFLLWADLINFMLGAEAVTSNSLASRTLLFDFCHQDWSEPLLNWSKIPREKLGRIVPGGVVVGQVTKKLAEELSLDPSVLLVSGGHDQCLNALGCGGISQGKVVCGLGTYECLTPIFAPVGEPLGFLKENLNMENHVLPGLAVAFLYNQAGILIRWFRDTFASAEASQPNIYDKLNQEMPKEPTSLLVLPHFEPVQWPTYLPETSGVIVGLKTSTTRGEILKAIMEGIVFHFVPGLTSLSRLGIPVAECLASGGGARSDAWLAIHADILGIPFVRPRVTEAGLTGCAILAGLATGVYSSPEEAASIFIKKEKVFYPDNTRHRIYQEKYRIYSRLYPAIKSVLASLTSEVKV
ncbi:MAG: FGGY family carbohydrate kinase [Candidatus Omnitrophica bacterium]|nr:FGGY family carbohydrate kinase [Candidatus Omnitrophota bacterium]